MLQLEGLSKQEADDRYNAAMKKYLEDLPVVDREKLQRMGAQPSA